MSQSLASTIAALRREIVELASGALHVEALDAGLFVVIPSEPGDFLLPAGAEGRERDDLLHRDRMLWISSASFTDEVYGRSSATGGVTTARCVLEEGARTLLPFVAIRRELGPAGAIHR